MGLLKIFELFDGGAPGTIYAKTVPYEPKRGGDKCSIAN